MISRGWTITSIEWSAFSGMQRMLKQESKAPQLIHFTREEGLIGILHNGFALMPCDRLLLDDLFGGERPFKGDPQNFGMVCFTDAPFNKAGPVRKKGDYGIAVKFAWAEQHGVRKVRYISRLYAWFMRFRFRKEMEHLSQQIDFPKDEGLKLAYKNKEFAAFMGAPGYGAALDDYEFMQTVRDKKQREWRITQPLPFDNSMPGEIPSPEGWGFLYFKKLEASDIEFLMCPTGKTKYILDKVPEQFRSLKIVELPNV